ncbi:MAG TPA: DUF4232 domain-containing protein [Gemmatimonadaceae bacterium]
MTLGRRRITVAPLLVAAVLSACDRRSARAGGATDSTPAARSASTAAPSPHARRSASGPAPCVASELTLRRVGGDAGAGHRAVRMGLVNGAAEPCTLGGYPGVALLDSTGRPVSGLRVERAAGTYLTGERPDSSLTLAPGAMAVFDVTWGVVEGEPGGCPTGTALAIAPPGAPGDTVGRVEVPVRACGARVQVTPVVDARLAR